MNINSFLVALTMMIVFACGVVNGQQRVGQDEKLVTSTDLVTINVVVTDQGGNYIPGLSRENFRVYDNGIAQQISHFSIAQDPVSIGIVLEVAEGRTEGTKAILSVLRTFARTMRDEDDFFLLSFGKGGSVTTNFIPTYDQVSDLRGLSTQRGQSSLYDAVFAAADQLRAKPNLKKTLLIVSDGQDRQSVTTYNKLRDRLQKFDVQVYAIGRSNSARNLAVIGQRWVFEDVTRNGGWRPPMLDSDVAMGRAVLAEMSRVSGGTTYFPEAENEPELMAICTQIPSRSAINIQ